MRFHSLPRGKKKKKEKTRGEFYLQTPAFIRLVRLIPRVYPTPTLDYNFLLHFHFISRPAKQGVETLASERAPEWDWNECVLNVIIAPSLGQIQGESERSWYISATRHENIATVILTKR